MDKQPVILVRVEEPQWTWAALHDACALARKQGGRVVLLHLMRVQHIAHLGTADCAPLTPQTIRDLQACTDMAAAYGIQCEAQVYQSYDLFGALCEAAVHWEAVAVFARLPHSMIPFWSECRHELLRYRLARCGADLYSQPASAPVVVGAQGVAPAPLTATLAA